ncbi:MAG: hypothetical protein V1794_14420, partial [Candidatus Glassbacteria bacterium]
FDRKDLKLFYNREINFWDFTTPYAHLECAGYGELTYRFESASAFKPRTFELSARMSADDRSPVQVLVSLNGAEVGVFELPGGDNKIPGIVVWRVDDPRRLEQVSIKAGENRLTFLISEKSNPQGRGIRIYAKKNAADPALGPEVPIVLKLGKGETKPAPEEFNIPVWGTEGENFSCRFYIPTPASSVMEPVRQQDQPLPLNQEDIRRGYVVFRRDWQRYVYPWTIPAAQERLEAVRLEAGRNDFEPLTLSLYPLRDLGKVTVAVSELRGPAGSRISSDQIQPYVVRPVKMHSRANQYRLVPRMLERGGSTTIPISCTTRFWLTLHADSSLAPGTYKGVISIRPELEPATDIPLSVEILPIKLEPRPDITYSMFMTYEFFELESKDLTAEQKRKVYRDGVTVFRDFIDHGLNSVDVSSPYFFQWNRDGSPRIEHLKGMIRGAREAGFTGPVYWYFAHYLQAAKSQHPGSILLYDSGVHTRRARSLVETALQLNRELGGLPLYFVPIDEPRIARRQEIALELFAAIKKVPGTTILASTDIGGDLLDIQNDGGGLLKRLGPGEKERKAERKVWQYVNEAVQSFNPAYSRYIYGYYTWRQDLDGMNSWGFNTAENSRGHPYEELDHPGSDENLAYPHPGGPLPTPNWEAVREGIDDVRYVYQLEKLIEARSAGHPQETGQAAAFLDELHRKCDIDENTMIGDFGPWTPEEFDKVREQVIGWILALQKL